MISSNLTTSKLGELFKFKQGLQVPVEEQFLNPQNGFTRFIRIVDVTKTDEPHRYIRTPDKSHLISVEDLFMVRYGAAGVVGFGYEGVIANNLFRLIPKKNLSTKYFYYLLTRHKSKLDIISTSSTMPALNFKDLNGLKITFDANFQKQKEIAKLLTCVDDKINLLTKKKEALETYKKGLMQKIFSQELRFKREDGADYPEWEICSLGEIGDLKNGFAFKSETYTDEGDFSIVTIKNVQNGKLVSDFNHVIELPNNIKKHQLLKKDDLLISMTGNVGRVCLVDQNNLLLNQRVGLIVLKNEVDKKICFYQLRQHSMLNYFISNGEGAAQPNISKDIILNTQIRIPTDHEEKMKTINFFAMLDNYTDKVQGLLESSEKLKKGLLQQMFV